MEIANEVLKRIIELAHNYGQWSVSDDVTDVSIEKSKQFANDFIDNLIYASTRDRREYINVEAKKECHFCKYNGGLPGNSHIQCKMPDINMTGDEYGIKKGYFLYPFLFDPIWKTKMCDNFEKK